MADNLKALLGPRASSKKTRIETPDMIQHRTGWRLGPRASSKKTRIEATIRDFR